MRKASVFIGRFQPFHLGHRFVLDHCRTELVHIGVGSSQYDHVLDNPFTFDERKTMITLALTDDFDIKYDIFPVPDIHDPPRWVNYVSMIIPPFDEVLTNNQFTSDLFEEQGYMVYCPGLQKRVDYSGKKIRRLMINNEPWEHLVPKKVASYLHKIDAEDRLQELSRKNK
jgi:nicotinamide-nucleotide adenylyltransferase